MSSGGTGDAESVQGRVVIAGYAIEDAESLEEAERRLSKMLGRPMTEDEREQLAGAHERLMQLEAEHGPDYHGFGHPPRHEGRG